MSKKSVVIMGGLIIGILVIIGVILKIWLGSLSSSLPVAVNQTANFQINFLQAEEQARMNIDPNLKIQVLDRTTAGDVQVYRIINNDSDIIYDPLQVETISPSQE